MMEMPPLPGLPDLEAQTERVEVWGLMQDYARQYGELCARMAREEERERCALICEARADKLAPTDPNPYFLEALDCAAAIRKG